MAIKNDKRHRTKNEMETLKRKGKALFIQGMSIAQISREIPVSRNTLTKWKIRGDWEKELSQVTQEVETKIKKQAVANLFDALEPEYKEVAANVRVLNNIVTQQVWKRDDSGRVLRDSEGKPIVNDKLKPKDIRHLSMIMASNVKTMRLLSGKSTENIDQNNTHSGQLDHNHMHKIKGPLDTYIEKMESGEISLEEGQSILGKIAMDLQDVQKAVSDG